MRQEAPTSQGRPIELIPSAGRLVRSLRDLGYDFVQAVADVVDNSIAASARRIDIALRFDGPSSWVRIADDGSGMTGGRLSEAMRYGARARYGAEDLGKFGLGLKTASLSQCRRLTVATRRAGRKAGISVRQIDLDHIATTDRWEILAPSTPPDAVLQPLARASGTVVLWENLDRLQTYRNGRGRWAERGFLKLAEDLGEHLSMVFHRFLSGEADGPAVQIRVNGVRLEPWDPFARDEPATRILPHSDIDLQTPDGIGLVRFQPYVLPPRERFSSEEAFHRAAGPRRWNAQQGLYIYRANRLIQSGGWCRLRAPDEHLKLARASLDFYPELDDAFQVNVAKVRVVLPGDLRERIRKPLEGLIAEAQRAYRRSADAGSGPSRARLSSARAREALEACAATAEERAILRRLGQRLLRRDPDLARCLGW